MILIKNHKVHYLCLFIDVLFEIFGDDVILCDSVVYKCGYILSCISRALINTIIPCFFYYIPWIPGISNSIVFFFFWLLDKILLLLFLISLLCCFVFFRTGIFHIIRSQRCRRVRSASWRCCSNCKYLFKFALDIN